MHSIFSGLFVVMLGYRFSEGLDADLYDVWLNKKADH